MQDSCRPGRSMRKSLFQGFRISARHSLPPQPDSKPRVYPLFPGKPPTYLTMWKHPPPTQLPGAQAATAAMLQLVRQNASGRAGAGRAATLPRPARLGCRPRPAAPAAGPATRRPEQAPSAPKQPAHLEAKTVKSARLPAPAPPLFLQPFPL